MDVPVFKFKKLDERAQPLKKAYEFPVGFDIAITHLVEVKNGVARYGTGWAVECPKGWYLELVSRSSTPTKGWSLPHSIGVIDEDYHGHIQVPLQPTSMLAAKTLQEYGCVDSSMEFLTNKLESQLPLHCVQLIPKRREDFSIEVVEELSESQRGTNGFGSSDKL